MSARSIAGDPIDAGHATGSREKHLGDPSDQASGEFSFSGVPDSISVVRARWLSDRTNLLHLGFPLWWDGMIQEQVQVPVHVRWPR